MQARLLTDEEIEERLAGGGWVRDGNEISRQWEFADFASALAAVNRVGEVAEEHNHHPDILLHGWNKLRLSLTNHSAGGLTEVDFDMARRFDGVL